MIEFQNISKRFSLKAFQGSFSALHQVSFSIRPQRITGLIGANGAGKTTSIKLMMKFIKPGDGQIIYNEELGRNFREIRQNIGYLPEHAIYYKYMTGMQYAKYMGELLGLEVNTIETSVLEMAKLFKLDHALDRSISTYSKGMMQRLGLITTVIHHPKFVILDEPLSGLDPLGRKQLKDMIKHIYDQGRTILFTAHTLSDIEEVCHDIIFIKRGELFFSGSIDGLLTKFPEKNLEEIFISENEA